MVKCYADIKRTWMPAQTTIPRNTVDHHNGQNKIFHDRNRFNQYLATNPALHKVLEGKLRPKEVGYLNKNTDN